MPGPYSVLGISLDASEQEIERAYRKKAILLHPDKNGGSVEAKERFIVLQKAFEKLTRQSEDEGKPVPSATRREPSPPPGSRRYRSPPPPRRTRDRSPPTLGVPSRDEPLFEERRPRDASPVREERRPDGYKDSFRPPPPPKERKYQPRGRSRSREDVHQRPRSPPTRRDPSPVYEIRKPGRTSSTNRTEDDRRKSTTKYTCTSTTLPHREQSRNAPSPFALPPGTQVLKLPSAAKLDELDREANKLVRGTHSSLRTMIDWLENTVRLEKHKDRMQSVYEAREDAVKLSCEQKRRETLTAELHRKGAWSLDQYDLEIIDLQKDILDLISNLRVADDGLYGLVKKVVSRDGSRFDKERDWSVERRNSLWDGIDRFRSQVKRLSRAPNVRTTTTTIRYKVKY